MKLRILGNSLRFRVTRNEFDRIVAGEEVGERVVFSPQSHLEYVVLAEDVPELGLSFTEGCLRVALPRALVERWRSPDEVGIRRSLANRAGGTLEVAIEKDYQCIGLTEEDQSDMFPNPARGNC